MNAVSANFYRFAAIATVAKTSSLDRLQARKTNEPLKPSNEPFAKINNCARAQWQLAIGISATFALGSEMY